MKHTLSRMLAVVSLAFFPLPGLASDPLQIGWQDLLPEERPYHDPFREMNYEHIRDLSKLFRLEFLQPEQDDADIKAQAASLRKELVAQGLDPDWLFEQREIVMHQRRLAATEANPEVLGKTVRIPGYMLPLEIQKENAVEFLLVPTVGACIHTPPPPANQMVYVRFEEGFKMEGLYKPVWISGEIHAQSRTQTLSFVDGVADIETSYIMDAHLVEPYEP